MVKLKFLKQFDQSQYWSCLLIEDFKKSMMVGLVMRLERNEVFKHS